ncbi:MAG: hypothetical protein HY512_04225 [Candidatus Aenigmarchaeota archaeon]|nr:hypothetical protein [Candidatus Aenigmarchaeota archaeon]
MGNLHLNGVKVGDFLEPDKNTGDLERAGLTASKRYEVLNVVRDRKDIFVTVQDDMGSRQRYSSCWFKYPVKG